MLAENYARFLGGMTAAQPAKEVGSDPNDVRFKGTLCLLLKRRVLIKDGAWILLNPAHLK